MSIEARPDRVLVARLADDPQFTAELEALMAGAADPAVGVVLDLSQVRYMNSSNLAKLLRLRKTLIEKDGRLILCAAGQQVLTVFQVTGLDRIFRFAANVDEAAELIKAPGWSHH